MKKQFKKVISLILCTCMMASCILAFADDNPAKSSSLSVNVQINQLLAEIDIEKLNAKMMSDAIDASVPKAISDSIKIVAEFQPAMGVSYDMYETESHSTIQNAGVVFLADGATADLYVAAASVELKEDHDLIINNGVRIDSYVYWLDYYGSDNQLAAVKGVWTPGDKVISDRTIEYGVCDFLGKIWLGTYETLYTQQDYLYWDVTTSHIGLTVGCRTKVNIVNVGVLSCMAYSRPVT